MMRYGRILVGILTLPLAIRVRTEIQKLRYRVAQSSSERAYLDGALHALAWVADSTQKSPSQLNTALGAHWYEPDRKAGRREREL